MGLYKLPLALLLYLQNAFQGFLQQITSVEAMFFFLVSEIWAEAEEGKRYSGRIKSQV